MKKEMLINVLQPEEIRIAILEDGVLEELYVERTSQESYVGNVYKGRVMRVLPGMQSAFVDIGLERDAFLYVTDFFDEEEEIERIVMEKGKKGSPEEAKREANEQIERSRVEREKQMESAQEVAEPLREHIGISDDEQRAEEAPPEEPAAEEHAAERGRDPRGVLQRRDPRASVVRGSRACQLR